MKIIKGDICSCLPVNAAFSFSNYTSIAERFYPLVI